MSEPQAFKIKPHRPEDPQIRAALAEIANGNYSIAIAWLHEARRIREAYANAPAMVNVPILRYSDPCPHGYLTYELDGVTFHRATLGVCADTSAPPHEWKATISSESDPPEVTYECADHGVIRGEANWRAHTRLLHP